MNIKLLALVMCLMLSGCLYQAADNTDIQKAVYLCGGVEDIDQVLMYATGSEVVICKDGTSTLLAEVKLPRKGEVK